MDKTTRAIEIWAIQRGLDKAEPTKQVLKLGEEYGELCQALLKDEMYEVVDAIGDMFVVLTVLSMQVGLSIECCVQEAYEEIRNRNGKMINGVFVKDI